MWIRVLPLTAIIEFSLLLLFVALILKLPGKRLPENEGVIGIRRRAKKRGLAKGRQNLASISAPKGTKRGNSEAQIKRFILCLCASFLYDVAVSPSLRKTGEQPSPSFFPRK